MKTEADPELRGWMDDWRNDPEPAEEARAAILRHVKRRSRRLVLFMVGDLAFAAGFLYLLGGFTLRADEPQDFALGLAASVLTVICLGLGMWNRRGLWRPPTGTTRACLDLSVLRCRRSLRAIGYGYAVLAVELLLLVPWALITIQRDPARRPLGLDPYLYTAGLMAILFGTFIIGFEWYRRRVRQELRELEELSRSLDE